MGTLTVSNRRPQSDGSYGRVDCLVAFGSSYNNTGNILTTGETINAKDLGFASIISIDTPSDVAGYGFNVLGLNTAQATSARLQVFESGGVASHFHALGTTDGEIALKDAVTSRIYFGVVTGGPFVVGESLSQATSAATAVVSGVNLSLNFVDVTTVAGTFDATHVVTGGTSGATATPSLTLVSLYATANDIYLIQSVETQAGTNLIVGGPGSTLAAGRVRHPIFNDSNLEVLASASASSLTVTYAVQVTGSTIPPGGASVEVPNGTNLSTALATVRLIVSGY